MDRFDLGVGVTWTPALRPIIEAGEVDVVEIEPETLWLERPDAPDGRRYRLQSGALDEVCALPGVKLAHSVAFPVGGGQPPPPKAIDLFAESVRTLDAVLASAHLSFNVVGESTGDAGTGFLMPPRQTPAGIEKAARAIRQMGGALAVPFSVETGVNYLRPRPDELTDGEFFAAVAREAGCGILLDLHNLWANERNGRQSVTEVVAHLPRDRIWEVHLAGGRPHLGYWLDAHSGLVPPQLMEVATVVLRELPEVRALVFEIMAPYLPEVGLDAVRYQLDALRALTTEPCSAAPAPAVPRGPSQTCDDVAEWEHALTRLATGHAAPVHEPGRALDDELAADPGTGVLRELVAAARRGTVVETMTLTCRLLLMALGDDAFDALLQRFWEQTPPALFPSGEALAFAAFLEGETFDTPWLADVAAFERAAIEVVLTEEQRTVTFGCDPGPLLAALHAGRRPPELLARRVELALLPATAASTPS